MSCDDLHNQFIINNTNIGSSLNNRAELHWFVSTVYCIFILARYVKCGINFNFPAPATVEFVLIECTEY